MCNVKRRKNPDEDICIWRKGQKLTKSICCRLEAFVPTVFRCQSLMNSCSNLDELSSDGPIQPYTSMHLRSHLHHTFRLHPECASGNKAVPKSEHSFRWLFCFLLVFSVVNRKRKSLLESSLIVADNNLYIDSTSVGVTRAGLSILHPNRGKTGASIIDIVTDVLEESLDSGTLPTVSNKVVIRLRWHLLVFSLELRSSVTVHGRARLGAH